MEDQTNKFKVHAIINQVAPPEAGALWAFYSMARSVFISKHPELYEGQSGIVIPTFEEEVSGRFMLADGAENHEKQGKRVPSQYLTDVLRIHQAGFLREYVWSYFNQPSWPDSQQPEKLISFIVWAMANLGNHCLETSGGVKIVRENPDGNQAVGNSHPTDVQGGGGAELQSLVERMNSVIQKGSHEEAGRLQAEFTQSAKSLRKETDATYCCFQSQRQLNYFLLSQPGLTKVRVMDWGVAWGSYLSAYFLSKLRRFADALSALEDVLKIAPFFAQGWMEKGYIFMSMRRPQEALAGYAQAWKLVMRHPENFNMAGPVLRGQAVVLAELGELDKAEKLLSDSLVVEPRHPLAMAELSYIAQRRMGGVRRPIMDITGKPGPANL
jgi:hypothetical protein